MRASRSQSTPAPSAPTEERLAAPARWRAGAAGATLLAGGIAALALAFELLPQFEPDALVGPAAPVLAEAALRLFAVLGGMAALVGAGRYGHAAITGRHPGPWSRWVDAAATAPTADLPE